MRDIAEDAKNWQGVMQAYFRMGRTLQMQCEYKHAIVVIKRLLQIAWLK